MLRLTEAVSPLTLQLTHILPAVLQFPLDLVQAESPKAVEVPQPHQNSINPTLEVPFVSQQEQTEAAPSSCSGFGLDPAAIFGQEPCQNHALPDSPSPTQISLPSSDNEGTSYEQQAAGLWTGLSSVTLNERNTSIPYASELSNVKEEKNEDKVSLPRTMLNWRKSRAPLNDLLKLEALTSNSQRDGSQFLWRRSKSFESQHFRLIQRTQTPWPCSSRHHQRYGSTLGHLQKI